MLSALMAWLIGSLDCALQAPPETPAEPTRGASLVIIVAPINKSESSCATSLFSL
jgi:hypothetical protein